MQVITIVTSSSASSQYDPMLKSPNAVDHDYDIVGHGDGDNDGDVYL